jgi:hypothetical protein
VKIIFNAGLLGLSLLVGTSGIVLAGPSDTVSAKSIEKKMTEGAFKKKIAEFAKMSKSIEKKQIKLLVELQTSQDGLTDQFLELLGYPTAVGTDPATATEPAVDSNPTTPATTQPSVTSATYNTDDQLASFYMETLTNIADQDPSVADFFDQAVLDELSPLADKVLTLYANAEKLSVSYDKLNQSYNNYVKQSKYSEALNVLSQQINLDKKQNDIYNSILSIQEEISSILSDGLPAQSDDESNSNDQGDHQNINHDDNKKKDRKHD